MDPPRAWDEFGTPYVVMTIGGIKEEGKEYPLTASRDFAAQAIQMYLTELEKWLGPRNFIHWRTAPCIFDDGGRIKIYSRLSAYIIQFKEHENAVHEGWQEGLQEGEQAVQQPTGANQGEVGTDSGPEEKQ